AIRQTPGRYDLETRRVVSTLPLGLPVERSAWMWIGRARVSSPPPTPGRAGLLLDVAWWLAWLAQQAPQPAGATGPADAQRDATHLTLAVLALCRCRRGGLEVACLDAVGSVELQGPQLGLDALQLV